jgi:hypothetical protein
MEKISAWLFIAWAVLAIPAVNSAISGAYTWIMVIVLAAIGVIELKANK